MLNELSALNASLCARHIPVKAQHPWIQPFKRGEALVAEVGPAGEIGRVSLLRAEEVASLRNIAPDFHNSFPGFNLDCPLVDLEGSVAWNNKDEQWKAALAIHQADIPLAYGHRELQRMKRLLGVFPQQELAPRLKDPGPAAEATVALIQRLSRTGNGVEGTLRQLATEIVNAMRQGRLSRELALSILFGKPNKKKFCLEAWKLTCILDVADLENFRFRVADPAAVREWNDLLQQYDNARAKDSKVSNFVCGVSGHGDIPVGDKMPNPNLPILGPSYLMSMNADIPCQTRYGRTSTEIFPVGRKTALELNNALWFITDRSRLYKTWAGVPNGFKDESDLMIAYLEEDPSADLPIAAFFADKEPDPEQELATYEQRVAPVYTALRAMDKPETDIYIRVFVLNSIDKGRRRVIFNGRYSATALFRAQANWISGTQNIPEIAVPFPIGKGKPAEWRKGYKPSPSEVMTSLKNQWLRAGQTRHTVPGVELGRIYDLFLEANPESQSRSLLSRYLPLTLPLLIGLGRSIRGGAGLPESARKEVLIVVAVYGILLLHLGRTKEIYMESRDYLLGQFLQLADLLHKLYCENERDGSIPPQLIGNAAITMAVQSPSRAFEVLAHRMVVYLAWVDRFQGEKAGLAKWTKKELGRISNMLKDQDLSSPVSIAGKAELLLGYLANSKPTQA